MIWKIFLPISWVSSPAWSTVTAVFWFSNWFAFWAMLACFVKDPFPKKILSGSALLLFVWGVFLFKGDASHQNTLVQLLTPVIKEIKPIARTGIDATLLPLLFGNAALGLGLKLGWGTIDPIKAGLRTAVRWPRQFDHGKYFSKAGRSGTTYLGFEVSTKKPVFLNPEERNKHIQVVGSTGSGKTRFALFPLMSQDIRAGRGVVFIDAKGSSENAKAVWKMVTEAGRTDDFLYFSLTDSEHSSTYNPLKHGNPSQLKDKITASIDWSEPFYQRICENALQTLFMDADRIGKRLTFFDLVQILRKPTSVYPAFFNLAQKHFTHIQTLESEVSLLVNSPFGDLLRDKENGIDLLDVYKNKKIVYFALDTQSFQHTAARLGKMITQDLNTLSGGVESRFSEADKRPLAIFIDEFQAFGTRGFINALARGRSSGFWITIAHQSLGDLKAVDEAFLQQVFENTNTKVFLKVNDPANAQLFSDSVGTAKAVETTSQVHLEGADPKNIMGSKRIVHEYLIHPTELKNLNTGQAVFKSGGGFGRLCLPGVFFSTEGIDLPVRRSLDSLTALKRVPPRGILGNGTFPDEEPIIDA
jgi:hypothetical protein